MMRICPIIAILVSLCKANSPGCGKTPIPPDLNYYEDKILGGKEAVPGSWSWQVAITSFGVQFCGGALIDETHVLTAAHCIGMVWTSSIVVHLGSHRMSSTDNEQQNVGVKEICYHRDYSGNLNDIAVLTLKKKVVFGDTIQPVCLPPNKQELPDRSALYVTGWGNNHEGVASEVLKQALTLSIESTRCNDIKPLPSPERVLCTSHDYGSSCHGDSGGPLVRAENDVWYLQGIVSGGPPVCGTKDWPMYFTKVSHFIDDWLKPVLRGNTTQCILS